MIRNEEQIHQLIKDIETILLFLESLDPVKHRDFLHYNLSPKNGRLNLIKEILSEHDYGIKPVAQAWIEHKYLTPPPYDFLEFYAGEEG